MSSILPTVFKAAIGLLVNKGTAVEMGKLQERDVTDLKFRSFVVREINQAESEMREEDLRASISYFKEGVIHFFEVLDNGQTKEKDAFEVPYVENTTPHMLLKYGDSILPISARSVSSDQTQWSFLQTAPRPTFEEPIDEPFQLLSIESSPSSEPSPSTGKVFEVRCEEDSPPQLLVSTDKLLKPFELKNPRPISMMPETPSEETFREMDYVKDRSSSPASIDTEESEGAPSSALLDGKKAFKNAYLKATEAFSNEDLNLSGRIQAMTIRVAATILEKLEYPEDALAPCMLYLEELHCMPAVQVSFAREFMIGLKSKVPFPRKRFKETIHSRKLGGISEPQIVSSTVCHVNRIAYDVLQTVRKVNLLMTWPCVNTKRLGVEEKVDPLRDSRVTSVLRELGMEYCCVVPWSFGQEGEDKHKLKDPRGIATSSDGEFIIADHGDRDVKVFDRSGKFKYSFCPMVADDNTELDIRDVAIDRNDCLYVLVRQRNSAGVKATVVCVFEKSGREHHFFLRKGFTGRNLTVDVNNKILVTSSSQKVEVYEPQHGQFIRSFGDETLKNAFAITAANDGRVMVLNKFHSDIQVFNEEGDHVFNFNVDGSYHTHDRCPKIAFQQASEHLVLGGFEKKKLRLDMLIYTKKGEFVRRIQYGEEKIAYITGITVTLEGRFAAVVRQVDSGRQLHSKVLVV